MASRLVRLGIASLAMLLAFAAFGILSHKGVSSGHHALAPFEVFSKHNASTPSEAAGNKQPVLNQQGVGLVMYLLADDMKDSLRGADTLLTADDTLRLSGIDLKTSAEHYDADYDANEVAADKKYEGKTFMLTGVIQSINKDFKGDAYLVLRASNPFMGVQAELNERGKTEASALAKGTTVYLVCDSGARIIGSAVARNCQQFSQHLDQINPSLKSAIEENLQGKSSLPKKLVQALRAMYVLGTQLPPDSPCFAGADDACKTSLAAITEDKAKMKVLSEQFRRTFPDGAASNPPPEQVAILMKEEDELNDKCRDGAEDAPETAEACAKRELLLTKIRAKNWCWGHDGQSGADRTWEPCRDDAARPASTETLTIP